MISMHGVPSSLIARNQSWVRQQANSLARKLPSNVEKADLIQAGLIAVAQAAVAFKWEGDRDTEEAQQAFVRYAQQRVRGAMLDELRQMDHLGRGQRRKIKALQIARERWQAERGSSPSLQELAEVTGMAVEEIAVLDQDAAAAQTRSASTDADDDMPARQIEPATPEDEVEARVDTAIVLRRLESFFATMPERERQAIDAYLGIGLSPTELADRFDLSPSRVSQLFKKGLERIAKHFGHAEHRVTDRPGVARADMEQLVAAREAEVGGAWGTLVQRALQAPVDVDSEGRIRVDANTRWM